MKNIIAIITGTKSEMIYIFTNLKLDHHLYIHLKTENNRNEGSMTIKHKNTMPAGSNIFSSPL